MYMSHMQKKRRAPENPGNSLFLYVCAVFLENGQAKIYKQKGISEEEYLVVIYLLHTISSFPPKISFQGDS